MNNVLGQRAVPALCLNGRESRDAQCKNLSCQQPATSTYIENYPWKSTLERREKPWGIFRQTEKEQEMGGEKRFSVAFIGYVFPSLYFTRVSFIGLSWAHAPQKHTHVHRTAKINLLLCIHRTQVCHCPEVLELCSYRIWTDPGYFYAQPCVFTWLFLLLSWVALLLAGLLSCSLLCFPGLFLQPFSNRRLFSLWEREVSGNTTSPLCLDKAAQNWCCNLPKTTLGKCLSQDVHLGSHVLLLHNHLPNILSPFPTGIPSVQSNFRSQQSWRH